MSYINIHDGTTHTLSPPSLLALAQTFEMVFAQYIRHSEIQEPRAGQHSLQGRHPRTTQTVSGQAFRLSFDWEGNRARLGAG
jgi:hypothetical protein